MSPQQTAAVIGAGIAGTSAAYKLKKAGLDVTIFEERDRMGGRIWSIQKGDFLMDLGTSAYLGTYKEAIELIHEVGLSSEFTERPALGGFPREGTNHYIDYTKMLSSGLKTKLLSTPAKIKALRMLVDVYKVRKSLGYDRYDQLEAVDTETVREYCRRVLNEELLQWLGRPLVSGTWVADDNDTSVALLLWTVRNMLAPNVYNLNSGVVGLPTKLATYVDTRLEHTVSNVTDNGSQVEVTYSEKGGPEKTGLFDTCVIAATAEPAQKMYPQMDDVTTELYANTRYRKLGSICLGLSKRPKSDATYFLVSPHEDPDTIAVISDHIKGGNRAPDGKGLLTVLLSHEYLERTEHLSDEQVLEYAVDRASKYHGYDVGADLEESMTVRWPMSVPTMDKGRFAMIANYHKKIDRGARVQFASDLDRISGLNGGLVSGQQAAARVIARTGAGIPAVTS
jgi:protoporphyrinogen/coproporphyrinogen III oxidase